MANTSGSILLRVVLQASGMSSSMSTPREGKIHQTVDERSYHLAELLPALFWPVVVSCEPTALI